MVRSVEVVYKEPSFCHSPVICRRCPTSKRCNGGSEGGLRAPKTPPLPPPSPIDGPIPALPGSGRRCSRRRGPGPGCPQPRAVFPDRTWRGGNAAAVGQNRGLWGGRCGEKGEGGVGGGGGEQCWTPNPQPQIQPSNVDLSPQIVNGSNGMEPRPPPQPHTWGSAPHLGVSPTCRRCRTPSARRSMTTRVLSSLPDTMRRSSAAKANTALLWGL